VHIKRVIHVLQGRDIWQRAQIKRKGILLANTHACWRVRPSGMSQESVVYSIGVGEDISFDLELIRRFGVQIHAFDPTPRSIRWLQPWSFRGPFAF
jgi:hypothetical protein